MRGARSSLGVLVLAVALLPAAACARSSERAPTIDADALTAEIDSLLGLNAAHDRLRAVVVMKRGRVVYEHYHRTTAKAFWNTDAVTTTVLTSLVGIALQEDRLPGLTSTIAELLPDRDLSPQVAGVTLRQLLTMTAGFGGLASDRTELFVQERDPVGAVLGAQTSAPGRFFNYSDQGAHLLSAVLERATGQSVLDYARSKLFDPLGIDTRPADEPLGTARALAGGSSRFRWAVDRGGLQLGWSGLRLRPRDLARLGQLFLDEGRWEDRQVVPENWARVATLTQVATGFEIAPGYGYGWWVDERNEDTAYYAFGYGGQLVEVLPRQGIVVAVVTEQVPENLLRGLFATELTFVVGQAIVPAVTKYP